MIFTFGIIYKSTNIINGKSYIGQTNATLEERMKRHFWEKKQQRFQKALNSYGRENFEWMILEVCHSETKVELKDELNKRERYWIKQYNTYVYDEGSHGYNQTRGGDKLYGKDNPFFGKKHTEEAKMKMRKQASKRNVSVIKLTMKGEFIAEYPSIKEAAKAVNGDMGAISSCLSGKISSHKMYGWIRKSNYKPKFPYSFCEWFQALYAQNWEEFMSNLWGFSGRDAIRKKYHLLQIEYKKYVRECKL